MRALCAVVLALTSYACSGQSKPATTPTQSEQPQPAADSNPDDTESGPSETGDMDSEEPCPELPSCGEE